jgi:small conductance mechanosensitive channel
MYLALARPFRIGDRIKAFGETGTISDVGMLYTRLMLENGDQMLASNSSIITTHIVLKTGKQDEEFATGAGMASTA